MVLSTLGCKKKKKSVCGGKKKSLREQRNQSVFKEQRARIPQPCDSAQQQSSLEPSRLPMALRMRASLFICCCVLALQCFPSTLCSPVRGSGRYKVAPVSRRMLLALLFVEAAAEFWRRFGRLRACELSSECIWIDLRSPTLKKVARSFSHSFHSLS